MRAGGSVFAEDEAGLLREAAATGRDLGRMLSDRLAGSPLEQVLGWAEFRGLRIRVEPGVFVPRLRTTFLVETALAHLAGAGSTAPIVLDLCCGSGAAGAAVEDALPDAAVFATDIEPAATACARSNLAHPERVFEGDLFDAVPTALLGRFDVILANAPYVPTDEITFMPQEARLHEPGSALDGGVDGLRIQARVAAAATDWLRPGGLLVIETSVRQAEATRELLAEAGLETRIRHSDDLDATLVAGVHLEKLDQSDSDS
ncbi:putative protein N(5)-glutamine methyltransferase [Frondihabitans sucicola]